MEKFSVELRGIRMAGRKRLWGQLLGGGARTVRFLLINKLESE